MGTVGLVSALVLVLLGTYVSQLALRSQLREQRIGELAADRAELLRDIVKVESLERRRLADQLHDGALQSALAARDDVWAALDGRPERLGSAADALAGVANDLRSVASDLWGVEPRLNVAEALTELAERHARDDGHDVVLEVEYGATEHDARVFAIARELLVNAGRHSAASTVRIELAADEHRVRLEVQDNGRGISQRDRADARARGHIGLASVEARVRAADGTFSIGPAAGAAGTIARVELPLASAPTLRSDEASVISRAPRAARTAASDAPA